MDRRTKIFAGFFGLLIAYAVFDRVVYPTWIVPLLTIDERISAKREELAKLEAVEDRVAAAKRRYKSWAERVGSFDEGKVETAIRAKFTQLIDKHRLADRNVSTTARTTDKQTDVARMLVTVKATGTLQQAVEFLRDVTETPQLTRIGNVKLNPLGTSSTRKVRPGDEPMSLTVPVEVWVLPQQRLVGPLKEEEFTQPEKLARHEDRDYSAIWKANPFTEWVPPVPLVAQAGPPVNVKPGDRAQLVGTVRGGQEPYKYQWSPADALSDATALNPTVDTSSEFSRTYTLSVTDEMGTTVSDKVTANVKERPKKDLAIGTPPPPPPPPPPGWPDARYMQLRMALVSSTPADRVSEVMVYNNKSHQAQYFAVGSEFDGGELLFVHPTGAVVRKKDAAAKADEYLIYPIGTFCDGHIPATDPVAVEFPELHLAATRLREATEKLAKAKADEAADAKTKEEAAPVAGDANTAPGTPPAAGVDAKPVGEEAKPAESDKNLAPKDDKPKPGAAPAKKTTTPEEAFRLRQYQQQRRNNRPPN